MAEHASNAGLLAAMVQVHFGYGYMQRIYWTQRRRYVLKMERTEDFVAGLRHSNPSSCFQIFSASVCRMPVVSSSLDCKVLLQRCPVLNAFGNSISCQR